MKVRIKRVGNGKLPEYKTEGSVGADCYANLSKPVVINPYGRTVIPLGFKVEIPRGYEIQIRPRSGLASKKGVFGILGTIDDDYRGEVCAIVFNGGHDNFIVNDGDRIAQMVMCPVERCEWEEGELSGTERGEGGFGSTGITDDNAPVEENVNLYEPFRHNDIAEAEYYLGHRVVIAGDDTIFGGAFSGTVINGVFVEVREVPTVVGKTLRFTFKCDDVGISGDPFLYMDSFRAFHKVTVDGHRFGKVFIDERR